jgi:hypothetical protein
VVTEEAMAMTVETEEAMAVEATVVIREQLS